MHIGIDARLYGREGRGLGRYIAELLFQLEEMDTVNTYTVVVRGVEEVGPLASNAAARGPASSRYYPKNPDRFHIVEARSRWYSIAEQIEIPRIFTRAGCDLVHIPHFNVPLLLRQPFVVTIHDLILLDFPTSHGSRLPRALYGAKYAAYRLVLRRAVVRAAHIFVPTQYVRERLFAQFPNVTTDRTTVTPEGATMVPPDPCAVIPTTPYILVVGSAYPHKNLETLMDAFWHVRQQHPTLQLVFVGKHDYFMERLKKFVENRNTGDVTFLGAVTDVHLAALYTHATALAFVSLEEGFGLPGFEALAHGTPVLAAHQASLPEVYGKNAVYVNPCDVADIARGIDVVLAVGKKRAPSTVFSGSGWGNVADKTLAAYNTVLGR